MATERATAPAPSRVDVVDGFRAYAILGVVALHLLLVSGALPVDTTFSQLGWALFGNVIDAFFIISGFVLFLGVASRAGDLGSTSAFAIGRGARLGPPYWVTLAVMLALLAFLPAPDPTTYANYEGLPSAASLVSNVAGLQMPVRMLDSNISVGFGINGPLWMISVIVCFYIVFPFVARPYYRHPLIGLALAAVITFGWREFVIHSPGALSAINIGDQPAWILQLTAIDQLPGWAFSFALGMTGAWFYARMKSPISPSIRRMAGWAAAVLFIAFAACSWAYGDHASSVSGSIGGGIARRSVVLGLAFTLSRAGLMAAIALGPLWMQRPFVGRVPEALARMSYGVYLVHLLIALYVGSTLLSLPTDGSAATVALWFGVVLAPALVFAYLVERWVERPSRRWARARAIPSGDRPTPASAAAAAQPAP